MCLSECSLESFCNDLPAYAVHSQYACSVLNGLVTAVSVKLRFFTSEASALSLAYYGYMFDFSHGYNYVMFVFVPVD